MYSGLKDGRVVKFVGDEVVTVTRFRKGETENCCELFHLLLLTAVWLRERKGRGLAGKVVSDYCES